MLRWEMNFIAFLDNDIPIVLWSKSVGIVAKPLELQLYMNPVFVFPVTSHCADECTSPPEIEHNILKLKNDTSRYQLYRYVIFVAVSL